MAEHNHHPRIGVTMGHKHNAPAPTYELGEAYLQAVIKAGGVPLVLPCGLPEETLSALLSQCSGLILTGGHDIDPQRYQDAPDDRSKGIDPRRDASEQFLIEQAMQQQIPILGICRGIQMLNTALGGTLYTDLIEDYPGSSKHDFYPDLPRDAYRHSITIETGNLFHEIIGKETIRVNSLHHQGIKDPAESLQVVGHPEDGSIEAVVATNHPWCIGVQWHPECLPEDQDAQHLFNAFIQAAGKFETTK